MSEPVENAAACACSRVSYKPRDNGDGTLSERWTCNDCGAEFVRAVRPGRGPLDGTIDEIHAAKAEAFENRKRATALEVELDTTKRDAESALEAKRSELEELKRQLEATAAEAPKP